jgi:NAD(P)H-hydrate epimerase
MDPGGPANFTLEQLMELAGLSVSQVVHREFPPTIHSRAVVVCGPGNNGGDGVVAARHLKMYGYKDVVCIIPKVPSVTSSGHFNRLITQARAAGVSVVTGDDIQTPLSTYEDGSDTTVVVDAIFGFSFKPPVRQSFREAMDFVATAKNVVSVDIPSGWGVDRPPSAGERTDDQFNPKVLVSLTTPKLGVKDFKGVHYVGGRFLDEATAAQFEINIPPFERDEQILKITKNVGDGGKGDESVVMVHVTAPSAYFLVGGAGRVEEEVDLRAECRS